MKKKKTFRRNCHSVNLVSAERRVRRDPHLTGVVNQEAKLHCLQQHDNPFNTWHTAVTSLSPHQSLLLCYIWLPLLTNFSQDVNSINARAHAYTHSSSKSGTDASRKGQIAGAQQSTARCVNTHTHTNAQSCTARWKITAGEVRMAWWINCGIKVLIGNKRVKTAIHHPGAGSNSHTSQTPALSYCTLQLRWHSPQIMLL